MWLICNFIFFIYVSNSFVYNFYKKDTMLSEFYSFLMKGQIYNKNLCLGFFIALEKYVTYIDAWE